MVELYKGDCLEVMKGIQDNSINAVVCDLPYGTTQCKWDSVIDLNKLWSEYKRLLKDKGVVILTASQPFTSILVNSNLSMFKYEWIWHKNKGGNPLNAKHQPMKQHESILVFCNGKAKYKPIKEERYGQGKTRTKYKVQGGRFKDDKVYGKTDGIVRNTKYDDLRYPQSVQFFEVERGLHPTQKPIALMEYLIKTHTNEEDLILDNTMGSGSTMVACQNTNRNGIGIEMDNKYFEIAKKRIEDNPLKLF